MPYFKGPVLLCDACGQAIIPRANTHTVETHELDEVGYYEPRFDTKGERTYHYHSRCLPLPPAPEGLPRDIGVDLAEDPDALAVSA